MNEASPLSFTQLKPELCWHPMEPCLQHCGHHRFMQLCPHCLVCSLACMLALVHKLQGCCRRHCTWPDVHLYLLDGCTVYRLLLARYKHLQASFRFTYRCCLVAFVRVGCGVGVPCVATSCVRVWYQVACQAVLVIRCRALTRVPFVDIGRLPCLCLACLHDVHLLWPLLQSACMWGSYSLGQLKHIP